MQIEELQKQTETEEVQEPKKSPVIDNSQTRITRKPKQKPKKVAEEVNVVKPKQMMFG